MMLPIPIVIKMQGKNLIKNTLTQYHLVLFICPSSYLEPLSLHIWYMKSSAFIKSLPFASIEENATLSTQNKLAPLSK